MQAATFLPPYPTLARLTRRTAAPFAVLLRTTGYRLRPPCARPFAATVTTRQHAVLARGAAGLHERADVRVEERGGPLPTIVVGGFVPDATEALYLLRGGLLRHGSVYYCNYPTRGFSTDLLLAQLEDLVEELARLRGRRPAVVAVSFGAGLVLELLRRAAARGDTLPLAGVALVSPVACAADLLDPAAPKPTTLLGRVIQPYLRGGAPDAGVVERSRTVFLRMFDSGAQNEEALRQLLTPDESRRLRAAVLGSIQAIDAAGACARVRALAALPAPAAPVPLCAGPAAVLYAEKEGAVLREDGPTRREFTARLQAWFPRGRCTVVASADGPPVQHASLIFHSREFRPPLASLYRAMRVGRAHAA
jgi:pimeloyl-ACP methyl ester carboxylesterase